MGKNIIPLSAEVVLRAEWENAITNSLDFSDATKTTYKQGLARFLDWLRENRTETVTTDTLEAWKEYLVKEKVRPTAINTWLSGVRKFYAWAELHGLEENPAAGVKNIKRKKANKKHLREALTDGEVVDVLALPDTTTPIGKRDYAYLCLRAFTAVRDIELHRADFEDLSYDDGLPVLYVQPKGGSEKTQPAVVWHPVAQNALNDWLLERGEWPGPLFTSYSDRSMQGRLSLSAIRSIVKRYMRTAGIKSRKKTSHSLRHSAISKVASKNLLKAQQMAGHSRPETTLIYVHEEDRIKDPGEQYIDYGGK